MVHLSQGVEPGTKAPLLPQYEKEKKSSKFICLFHIGHQSALVNTSFVCIYVCMHVCMYDCHFNFWWFECMYYVMYYVM